MSHLPCLPLNRNVQYNTSSNDLVLVYTPSFSVPLHQVAIKDEGGVLKCLIQFKVEKGDALMGEACAAAVEHWQILALKDWRFSAKFKKACQKDVKAICKP